MTIRLKRVYEPAEKNDGWRVLVDRLWPRGFSREKAHLDEWCKEIAPSDSLRRRFGHAPEQWDDFRRCYFAELEQKEELVAELAAKAQQGRVTLIFAARDQKRNNALALKEFLEQRRRGLQ